MTPSLLDGMDALGCCFGLLSIWVSSSAVPDDVISTYMVTPFWLLLSMYACMLCMYVCTVLCCTVLYCTDVLYS